MITKSWYYIAYNITNSTTGVISGFGSIELEMVVTPRNASEVLALADHITDLSHAKGELLGRRVHVVAWSKMGEI